MEITIPVSSDFNHRRTLYSHGWYGLAPFECDTKRDQLTRVLDTPNRRPITATIREGRKSLIVSVPRALGKRAEEKVIRDVRHMFRLDDDMNGFYSEVDRDPEFAWIRRQGAGRMLRSPTVWEDLVKSITTTNCSWALTTIMVNGLVNELGEETTDGRRQFPTPQAMAAMPEKFYRDVIRAGYRSSYFRELAERVASGEIDVEAWFASDLPTELLKKEMKKVKGVGDYAAENLLKLVGRYDGLALDSWLRSQFALLRNNGRKASDKKIGKFYKRFNSWQGLAIWCDMTREWVKADAG